MIVINSDLNSLIIIKNFMFLEFSIFFLLFSIVSLIRLKKTDKDYFIFLMPFVLAGFLFSASGIIDGFYKYFNLFFGFYYYGFNLLPFIIALHSLFSLFIGIKILIKSTGINTGNFKEDINPQVIKKYNISEREVEVIKELASGKTNKEISDSMFISLSTVRTHIYNIFQKSNAKNRVEIINLFFKAL